MNQQPSWLSELDFGEKGLLPVVVQDINDGTVLMLAYADREAVSRTLRDGKAWFYSRSRQEYWLKGASSGNFLNVRSIGYDCDADSLLYQVEARGPACHTGERSCFYRTWPVDGTSESNAAQEDAGTGLSFLQYLHELVQERKQNPPEGSYVAGLLAAGEDRMLQKVGEEAVEVILAGKKPLNQPDLREEFLGEAADLLFHLTVFLSAKQVEWREIMNVLERRHRSR